MRAAAGMRPSTQGTHRGDVVVTQRVVVGDALPRVNQLDVLPAVQRTGSG